jgi:hypothetical protein
MSAINGRISVDYLFNDLSDLGTNNDG